MDILREKLGISRYYIIDSLKNTLPEGFGDFAFQPIDEVLQDSSFGLVQLEDYEEPIHTPHYLGEYLFLRLRIDQRKIPTAILNRRYRQALKNEMDSAKAQGIKAISKARKKELRETVRTQLLQKTEPTPKTVGIVVTPEEIWVLSTSSNDLDIAEGIFGPLLPVNPYTIQNIHRVKTGELDADQVAATNDGGDSVRSFLANICNGLSSRFILSNEVKLSDGMDKMTFQGAGVGDLPQVEGAVRDGWVAYKAALSAVLESGTYNFDLNHDYSFGKVKVPPMEDRPDDIPGTLLEKVYLLGELFKALDAKVSMLPTSKAA